MKTQISRSTFNRENRYSGVYQQMGRMITDADWNELNDLLKQQLNSALYDIIGRGIPRERGLVVETSPGNYQLQWGHAYVEGMHAESRANSDAFAAAFNFSQQADFPIESSLSVGEHQLYLDVWERTVTHLENEGLLDPGLKGADTCTRTQTMAQVKACSLDYDQNDIEGNTGINPSIGNLRVDLSIRQGQVLNDPCDPCAEELSLPEDVGNFLFRLEVHEVSWSNEATPQITGLTLKWSSENAAEAYEVAHNPPGYQSDQWAYEFFSGTDTDTPAKHMTTEKHLGHHLMNGFSPVRGKLTDGFKPEDASGMKLVRRWDGFATFEINAGNWQLIEGYDRGRELSEGYSSTAHGYVDFSSHGEINLNQLLLRFSLENPIALAGDYWLAEIRESIHQANSVVMSEQTPNGIFHHYWLLGTATVEEVEGENTITQFSPLKSTCKAFEFPPLTDITSKDICYLLENCGDAEQATIRSLLKQKLGEAFPDAGEHTQLKTIIDAILCEHSATTLPLNKQAQLCPTLQEAEIVSVQDALNALCRREVDGCATFTVFPVPGWEDVFNKIGDNQDAHLCFREGQYELTDNLDVIGKGHLTICGAGVGTHIFSPLESAINFVDCASVSIGKMKIEGRSAVAGEDNIRHINGALSFIDCGEVNVSHTLLRCAAGIEPATACLSVNYTNGKTGMASITDNHLDVGHQQIGMLLNNLSRTHVENNVIKTRPKPRSMTLERQLISRQMAARARKYLVNKGEVRDFDASGSRRKKNIQLTANRQVLIDSPISSNHWLETIQLEVGNQRLKSNQELLYVVKDVAGRVIRDEGFRIDKPAFNRWYELLRQQNPAVIYKAIVCGGRKATEIRILNNTIEGAQEGIHVGVSHHNLEERSVFRAGRVSIENNTINVLIPPLFIHRRGGIFVGNCNNLNVSNNQISVQRFPLTRRLPVEAIRIYGHMGRMVVVDQNYSTQCTTGIRFVPLDVNLKQRNQWLFSDNMMSEVSFLISTPNPRLIIDRNNLR